jgi:hypothetical protein
MDLRDPWTDGHRTRWITQIHRRVADFWYRKCLDAASAVIANTPAHFELIRATCPRVAPRLYCIRNGYFEADFASRLERRHTELTIVYAGSMYGGNVSIRRIRERADAIGVAVEVRVLGTNVKSSVYDFCGVVSPIKVCEELISADLLFLYMPPQASRGPVMSLKAYSYIRSGRPIIYKGPRNETFSYLNARAQVVDMDDTASLERLLRNPVSGFQARMMDVASESWEVKLPTVQAVLDAAVRSDARSP